MASNYTGSYGITKLNAYTVWGGEWPGVTIGFIVFCIGTQRKQSVSLRFASEPQETIDQSLRYHAQMVFGVNNCDDGRDEQGVPAVTGAQKCLDPFVSDVQFQCTDGSGCTHIAAKCNGVNNCADSTTTTGLTIDSMIGYTVSCRDSSHSFRGCL